MPLFHDDRQDEAKAIAQSFQEDGDTVENFIQFLALRIEGDGSPRECDIAALADVARYVEFVASETLIQKLVDLALHDKSRTIRRSALFILGGVQPQGHAAENKVDDLWPFVLQNDEAVECRQAAIEAIYRRRIVDANYDTLLAALSDVDDVSTWAIVALEDATPTPHLLSILTGLLAKHPGTWAFDIALNSLCTLIGRGFRMTVEWRSAVACLLAAVAEFSGPDDLERVAKVHTAAISRNAATSAEAISELMREFDQRRSYAGADAYLNKLCEVLVSD